MCKITVSYFVSQFSNFITLAVSVRNSVSGLVPHAWSRLTGDRAEYRGLKGVFDEFIAHQHWQLEYIRIVSVVIVVALCSCKLSLCTEVSKLLVTDEKAKSSKMVRGGNTEENQPQSEPDSDEELSKTDNWQMHQQDINVVSIFCFLVYTLACGDFGQCTVCVCVLT